MEVKYSNSVSDDSEKHFDYWGLDPFLIYSLCGSGHGEVCVERWRESHKLFLTSSRATKLLMSSQSSSERSQINISLSECVQQVLGRGSAFYIGCHFNSKRSEMVFIPTLIRPFELNFDFEVSLYDSTTKCVANKDKTKGGNCNHWMQ